MSQEVWSKLHLNYKKQDWIDNPSLFAETAIKYFPKKGKNFDFNKCLNSATIGFSGGRINYGQEIKIREI